MLWVVVSFIFYYSWNQPVENFRGKCLMGVQNLGIFKIENIWGLVDVCVQTQQLC